MLRINRDCQYYNWGGNSERGYPSYPKGFGARCEYFDEFFYEAADQVYPCCDNCNLGDEDDGK